MRSAVNNAGKAFQTASDTGANLGNEAQGIGANLTPFLTQEMLHPQGLGQEGIGAETSAALAGGGGAASGLTGGALQRAAVSHNTGGVDAALDSVARERMKSAGQASEGIQAQNQNLMEQQRQSGAAGLGKMYGVDTSGMLESQGQEANDINSQVNAGQSGWLQNTMGILKMLNPGGKIGGISFGGG
jgi:hypothetical protein